MRHALLAEFGDLTPASFSSSWSSPANIALVKYWGKKGHQLPANPSVSMTLTECMSTTISTFSAAESLGVEVHFENRSSAPFAQKILHYLENLQSELPWLRNLSVSIQTSNTFPHGAGIASSASGLSAFALTLTDYLYHLRGLRRDELFYKRASFLARLASGSAARSIYGGFTTWGESFLSDSSDEFASKLKVHAEFDQVMNSILVVNSQEKKVSSSMGHGRMGEHVFAAARWHQARTHFEVCTRALQEGNWSEVGRIMEAEALALHALMMTSNPCYLLLVPESLKLIQAIWDFRKESGLPVYFTLDAGPNLHVIYPESCSAKIHTFIHHELTPFTQQVIHDRIGTGPVACRS
jgi:diphosphomevalonate decarboxylase